MKNATAPTAGCCRSVLVVEDEFLIAMELVEILTKHNFDVVGTEASVESALKFLEWQTPDVAVLDGNLCGQSAGPVALRLNALSVPFVVASAYSNRDIDGSGVFANAVNVGKPIRETRLIEAVHRAAAP